MIRYALQCDGGHGFEAWFGDSAAYDDQASRGLVECPHCGSRGVSKQIMALPWPEHASPPSRLIPKRCGPS